MARLGRSFSLATSYDIAFLHLLLAGLEDAPTQALPCTALPFKKVAVRQLSDGSQRWLAAINILLLEAKCRDDLTDEASWKSKTGHRILAKPSSQARERLADFGFPVHLLTELPLRQVRLERGGEPTLEGLAKPTSEMLGEVFAFVARLTERPEQRVALRQLGQGLGAAIYIKDAIEDLEKDRRRRRFNALQNTGREAGSRYVHTALRREIQRASFGLQGLPLGLESQPLQAILDSLTPADPGLVGPTVASRFRRRAGQRGFLECLCAPCVEACCGQLLCEGCCHLGCGACGCDTGQGSSKTTPNTRAVPERSLPCPACEFGMLRLSYGAVEFDECQRCLGVWLDHGELEQLAAMDYVPPRLTTKRTSDRVQLRPEGTRSCPRCAEFLTVMMVKGVRLDVCPACRGLWLDQNELNQLLDSADSKS